MSDTSWENVSSWYHQLVGKEGHHYHKMIMQNLLRLLDLNPQQPNRLLDLGCGQGIASQFLPASVAYVGLDSSRSLIQFAKKNAKPQQSYLLADITQPLPIDDNSFTHAIIVLAIQNVEDAARVIKNAAQALQVGGRFIVVLNHPCFRIPRQSSWGVDPNKHLQYRRVDSYLSSMKIPIQMQPGKGEKSVVTWSFHHPLSAYIRWFQEAGLVVDALEEWTSDKKSSGKQARMENRARTEIPLFLALRGLRLSNNPR